MYYVTLHQVRQSIGNLDGNTADDALLLKYIKWATDFVNRYKGRRYDVRLATIPHDAPLARFSSFGVFDREYGAGSPLPPLILQDDLLEMLELTNGDGEEITSNHYVLQPSRSTPYSVVKLRGGAQWAANSDGNVAGALQVEGVWGYHTDYANAFVDSLDTVQDNPLSSSSTTIHVSSLSAPAADLESPRFQAGQLLRIDGEFFYLVDAQDGAESAELTVVRAYNGTAAAEHAQGAKVEIFRPEGFVVQACERLVKWRYSQRDTDSFDRTYNVGTGVVSTPTAIPVDVRDILGAKGRPSL